MTSNNRQQAFTAIAAISKALLNTIIESGSTGAPAGHLYAAAMTAGLQLDHFEKIMAILVETGHVRRSGDLYFAGPKNAR